METQRAWERARSDEQKEQRVKALVMATANLFEVDSFENISLAAIAHTAGFTRSNVYKYFQTKEDIFLELIKSDIAQWRKDLLKTFENIQTCTVEQFTQHWTAVMLRHDRMLRLYAILFSALEKNCSIEKLIAFKFALVQELGILGNLLKRLFSTMNLDKSTQFLTLTIALASGLYPMTQLSAAKQQAMTAAQLQVLFIDIEKSLYTGPLALIQSYVSKSSES